MAQAQTEVIQTANNNYYVVWFDTVTNEVEAQEFGANGVSITTPMVLVGAGLPASLSNVAVASNGDLDLAWNSLNNTYYATYTPNLVFTGVFLNPLAANSGGAAVTALPDGNSIVTSLSPAAGPLDVVATRISPTGSAVVVQTIAVPSLGTGQTSLATLSSGNVVFTYFSAGKILFDVMNENGTILSSGSGASVTAVTPTPNVAALASGGFVIVSDFSGTVDAEVFASDGTVVRNVFAVTPNSLTNSNPSVTATPDGGFIVAWQDNSPIQSVEQRFDPTGNPVGSPVTLINNNNTVSSATTLSDGQTAFGFNTSGSDNLVLDTRASVSDNATGGSFLGGGTGDFLLASAANANNGPGGIVSLSVLSNGVRTPIGALGTDWSTDLSANFSGNGMDDLLAHQTVGADEFYDIFQMGQNGLGPNTPIGTWGTGWQAVGSGNFAGASAPPDVLMQMVSGGFDTLQVAFIGANNAQTGVEQVGKLTSDWQAVGAGNFNGSGTDEILLQSHANGHLNLQILNITNGLPSFIGPFGSNWTVDGVGNFGGAGTVGILMEEDTSAGRTLGFATI